MNLIFATLIGLSFPAGHAADSVAAARRIAASVQLAAQEYRVGVVDGRVTVPGELDEARLFLTEARRTASTLSPRLATAVIADIDRLLDLVRHVAAPDSITALARRTTDDLAMMLGVSLDEIPDRTPSLKRGAEVFQRECSTCHGALGAGDGPAGRMLLPPPASLRSGAGLADVTPLSF
jgi:high-affinity iron transporter